jgi:hypothetical protein
MRLRQGSCTRTLRQGSRVHNPRQGSRVHNPRQGSRMHNPRQGSHMHNPRQGSRMHNPRQDSRIHNLSRCSTISTLSPCNMNTITTHHPTSTLPPLPPLVCILMRVLPCPRRSRSYPADPDVPLKPRSKRTRVARRFDGPEWCIHKALKQRRRTLSVMISLTD